MVRLGEDKWQYSVLLTATMVGGCRPRVRQRRRTAHPLLMLLLLLRRSVSTAVRQSEPGGSQPNASYIHVQYMCYMCIAHVSHTYYDMCIAHGPSHMYRTYICILHVSHIYVYHVSHMYRPYMCDTHVAHVSHIQPRRGLTTGGPQLPATAARAEVG